LEGSIDDDDKLDYLQYLKSCSGGFKCGICGKIKKARKYMLRHLKQHDEVPTYNCSLCTEKFVFRKKYERHILSHGSQLFETSGVQLEEFSGDSDEEVQRDEANVDEHPKFQEVAPKAELKCNICQLTFKLTIMMNRHNSTWHADDNPDKELSMEQQKEKKEVQPLKLLRCKHCLEAFIQPGELKNHLKEKHDSESVDQPKDKEEEPAAPVASFSCGRCTLVFEEKQFLDNHQKFFCIHRASSAATTKTEVKEGVTNEQ
jgi:hypothetical protein